ncbi:MAG TPA: TIR domain-containing protein [Phenylobacterium sp.]|jgi:adenylate cyclase
MSDVFISYARSTEAQARQVAEALRALGYGVWRDDELPVHRAYADVIAERLNAAKAVVVVWSAEAAKSEWVRSEAESARGDRKLVQLTVDGAKLPMPFDQIQCADLTGWTGDTQAPGWLKVLGSIADLTKQSAQAPAEKPAEPTMPARPLSVCVLPFANMSGDPEQEYFSDGVSEDIITDLSKVSALSVVSRNSAFQFKGKHVDLRQVARQLGVSHVLEGSVRKAGNRVRITAQLIEATHDSHIWAERYDRDLTDIFAVQDEISQAIVAALRLKLLPAEKSAIERRGTSNPDAYNLYLKARNLWISGNSDRRGLEEIVRLCQRVTEIDGAYAYAWVLMALAQMTLHLRHGIAQETGQAAADHALRLDANLAEAHAVKAIYFTANERFDDGNAEIGLALRLDPTSYDVNLNAGYVNFRQKRLAEAARYFEAAAALMDTSFSAPAMMTTCLVAIGDDRGAERAARMTLERAERAVAQDQSNGQAMGFVAGAMATLGDEARTREWIARALRIDPDNRSMRYNLACALALNLGDSEGAIDLLTPYFPSVTRSELNHIAIDPDMERLRDHPRFKALIAEAEARLGSAGPPPSP